MVLFQRLCSHCHSRSVVYHRAQAVPPVQRLDRLVRRLGHVPVRLELMRHVVVHRQLTRQAPLHQPRHRTSALPPSKRGTFPDASGDELERPRGDLLTSRGDADDAGFAPAAVRALERRAHHLRVAGAVEGVVHAPLGHTCNKS